MAIGWVQALMPKILFIGTMESGQHRMTLRCLLSVRGSRLQGLHGDEGNFLGNTPQTKRTFHWKTFRKPIAKVPVLCRWNQFWTKNQQSYSNWCFFVKTKQWKTPRKFVAAVKKTPCRYLGCENQNSWMPKKLSHNAWFFLGVYEFGD